MRAILARAIEIDGHHVLTIDQLQSIAAEVGVSQHALGVAIREATTSRPHPDVPTHGAIIARRLVGIGVPIGADAGAIMASGPAVAVVGVMGIGLVVSGALALYESESGTLRSFHIKNLALWGGTLAGSIATATLLSGSGDRASLLLAGAWCVRGAITSGILGSATMLAVHRARRGADVDSSRPPTAHMAAGGNTLRSRLLRRLRHALRATMRQTRATTATRVPAA
jgi:hypothetical protein